MDIPQTVVAAVGTDIAFTTTALIAVILRLYTRAVIVKNLGVDDYLMIASMCGSILFLTVVFLQIQYGLGRELSPEELPRFLEALWGTIPLYNVALIFCKLSIAFQYFRLFRSPSIHKALIGVISFLVVYGLWAIIGTIFTCYPVQKYWDPAVEGVCLNRNAITFANAGINICSDLTLLIIPIPLLKSLQLPRRQKYVLVGVFLCGGLACTMSIIRLWSLYEIGHAAPPQQSVNGVNIAIWSCIEINTGIVCASVPALKAMAAKVFPKILSSGIYSRSRFRNARYIRHEGGDNGSVPPDGPEQPVSNDSSSKTPRITIEQSFEMNSINSQSRQETEAESSDWGEKRLSQGDWKVANFDKQEPKRSSGV